MFCFYSHFGISHCHLLTLRGVMVSLFPQYSVLPLPSKFFLFHPLTGRLCLFCSFQHVSVVNNRVYFGFCYISSPPPPQGT